MGLWYNTRTMEAREKTYARIRPAFVYWPAALLSLGWLGAIAYFVAVGGINLYSGTPYAVAVSALQTIALPLALIWGFALIIERAVNSAYERRIIIPFLKNAMGPDGSLAKLVEERIRTETAHANKILNELDKKLANSAEFLSLRANQVLSTIDEKSVDFVTRANIASERIGSVASDLARSINAADEVSASTRSFVAAALDKIDKHSTFISERVEAQAKSFTEKSGELLSLVGATSKQFVHLEEMLGGLTGGIRKSFKEIALEVAEQKDALFRASVEVAENVSKLAAGLKTEKDIFMNSVEELKGAAETTSESIRVSSDKISSTSAEVKRAIEEIGAAMLDSNSNLGSQAEIAKKRAEEIRETMRGEIVSLEEIANHVRAQTRIGELSIQAEGKNLAAAMDNLISQVGTMNDKISATANNVLSLGGKIGDQLLDVNSTIVARTTGASDIMKKSLEQTAAAVGDFKSVADKFLSQSAGTSDELKKLLFELKSGALSLESTAKASREHMGAMHAELGRAAGAIPALAKSANDDAARVEAAANEIISTLAKVSEEFSGFVKKKTGELEVLSNSTTKTITTVAGYANKMNIDAQNSIETFAAQYKEMKDEASAANARLASLVENLGANKDALRALSGAASPAAADGEFLNRAGYIIEKLYSISIDIAKLVAPEEANAVWAKYEGGDKGVFVKIVRNELGSKPLEALRQILAEDKDFRLAAETFMSQFESLATRAKATPRGEILLGAILESDLGRLQMLLASAM